MALGMFIIKFLEDTGFAQKVQNKAVSRFYEGFANTFANPALLPGPK